jgi:biopolymer transport protein ExbD
MAAMDNPVSNRHQSGKRVVKKSTMVDLTPMVDLGFLLITFFVFTTTMAKPTVMKVEVPLETGITTDICNSCALTTILCDNDFIQYYEGSIDTAVVKTTDFKTIRQIIQQKKKKVFAARGNADEFVLIIKPTDKSSFKNFVDITDEVTINQVKRYYIDGIREEEKVKLGF